MIDANETDSDMWRWAWTGGNALQFRTGPRGFTHDNFHWISSGKSFPTGYGGWASTDPNRILHDNGEYESCLAISKGEKMYDADCNIKLLSLCQQEFP
jgi:hypothetical protein